VTDAARADEYAEYLERTGARECRATPGNRGVYVLRRIKQHRAEFTFISLWESFDAIRRFAERIMRKPTTTRKTATSSSSSSPSSTITKSSPELSLDPADAGGWEELRLLGHRMVDEMLEYLRTVRERPVWRPVPAEVRERLSGAVPRKPTPVGDVYEEFKRDVLPYPTGNIHPRFWGGDRDRHAGRDARRYAGLRHESAGRRIRRRSGSRRESGHRLARRAARTAC